MYITSNYNSHIYERILQSTYIILSTGKFGVKIFDNNLKNSNFDNSMIVQRVFIGYRFDFREGEGGMRRNCDGEELVINATTRFESP